MAPELAGAPVPWWRGAVIYQIYPRSFCDSNGDGVGDLAGIADKLIYVASLGVDAIWLSPFFASPMKDFGYDVSDYRAVDPIFGTLEDFDRLLARAHELGLKVVIDQVYAHTSDAHAWFQESRADRTNPKSDWYVWADPRPDGTPPNNWLSVFYGPSWTWDGRRSQYYMHNFLPTQPNLNVNNTTVQEALFDTARFWLARGVDGFRLDAINFAMHDPMLADNPPVLDGGGQAAALRLPAPPAQPVPAGTDPLHRAAVENGDRLRSRSLHRGGSGRRAGALRNEDLHHGQKRLNTSYGFDFLSAERLSPGLILNTLAQWPGNAGEGWPSWAFSNHDAPRVVSRWDDGSDSDDRAKLLLALLMSLRGNVFLYQGEELGLTQAKIAFEDLRDPEAIANWPLTQGRDGARTPMPWDEKAPHAGFSPAKPWLPIPDDHVRHAVSVQNGQADSVLMRARELIELRRSNRALRIGNFTPLSLTSPLLGFERQCGKIRMRCVFNLSGQAQNCDTPLDGECLFSCGTVDRQARQFGPWSACLLLI